MVGLVSLLSVVTLRQDLAGAAGSDPATLDAVGRSLVAVHDWTFLLGPAFGNGLLLGYRSGLVPRRMAMLGIWLIAKGFRQREYQHPLVPAR